MCHSHIFHNEVWRMIKKWLKSDKIVTLSELHAGGKISEFHCLVFRNGRFHSYRTGLTSYKSLVEPRTFLLWGDGTNHCIVLPQTIKIWVFQGAKPNHQGFILNSHQCVVARMQLLPPVTRRPGCRDFLCYARRRKQEGTMLGVRKRGQEGLSTLVFSPDIICTWAHPLWLMSHITSAVCSQEVSHVLSLRCKRHYLTRPLTTVPQQDTGGTVVSFRHVHSSKK